MSKFDYLQLKDLLARKVGLQRKLKRDRLFANIGVSDTYKRFDRNSKKLDGQDLVPRQAVYDLLGLTKALADLESRIQLNRNKIRELQVRLTTMKLQRQLSLAMERAFKNQKKTTPRDVLQKIFNLQGLFLHENGELSNINGRLMGYIGDVSMKDDKLEYHFKPFKTLDFIMLNLDVKDLRSTV